jgi:hypothetical protein
MSDIHPKLLPLVEGAERQSKHPELIKANGIKWKYPSKAA